MIKNQKVISILVLCKKISVTKKRTEIISNPIFWIFWCFINLAVSEIFIPFISKVSENLFLRKTEREIQINERYHLK